MGVSLMHLTYDYVHEFEENIENIGTPLLKKLNCIFKECKAHFDPEKEYGLKKFYDDRGACVVPEYRGLSIAAQLGKARRLVSKAHGIPMTGAWMTAYGAQKAAARDGWKTVKELSYDYLGKKLGVTFVDAPPTMKYMIADLKSVTDEELA